jgi:hypothetical protein
VVDVFEEVDEQLRSETYTKLVRKAGPWILAGLGAVAIVVLAVWGVQAYSDHTTNKASQAYARGLEALGRGDTTAAFSQFGIVANSPAKAYGALALMQQAGIKLDQHNNAEAVAFFDRAAARAPNLVIGDAARLKAALVLLDTAPYPASEARLKPLTDPQHPYAALAREALAVAKLNAGRVKEARADFVALSTLLYATDNIRQTAEAAIGLIDSGSVQSLPALVKAAAALPPPAANRAQNNPLNGQPTSDQTSQAGAGQ